MGERLRTLLFEPGQGWLRWGYDSRDDYRSYDEPPERYRVAPPARRLALYVTAWLVVPWLMVVGVRPGPGERRYRYSWEEVRPEWPSYLKDEDR